MNTFKSTLILAFAAFTISCSNDESPTNIGNGDWAMEKIVAKIGDQEFEINTVSAARVKFQDGSFLYSESGQNLTGSWSLDLAAKELSITNPNGTEQKFPLVSLTNDRLTFEAYEIDFSKSSFSEAEDRMMDMTNMKMIEKGKDFDAVSAGEDSMMILFVLKKI